MILLLGGTSESVTIARRLAAAGLQVLVSTATDEPMELGEIERRCGRLDEAGMAALARERGATAIVDATHPYATAARATARAVAQQLALPYFTFIRPTTPAAGVYVAADHDEAARIAFSFGRPVLLTSGANNLKPYVDEARRTGVPLVVRVLNRPESLEACRAVGITEDRTVAAKGPFTVEENCEHIRRFRIGVLVTKDSGEAGGVPAKIEAAQSEGCELVMIARPPGEARATFADIDALVDAVRRELTTEHTESTEARE